MDRTNNRHAPAAPKRGPVPYLALLFGAALFWGCSGGEKKAAEAAPDSVAAVSAPGAPVKMTGDLKNGQAVYERYCHFCHGRKGYGDGPVGIAITPHPADFVNDAKRMSKTDPELFKSITEGVHRAIGGEEMAMPRWQEILSDQERWDVLIYIRHLGVEGRKEQGAGKK
ncbi:MAG: cytochrome c [Deltaproteobacteria bacterium]|nr:cytochrome c [Deltaproteobacteria bacterium]